MVANRLYEVHLTTRAKGRVERSFETAQDRLVKGLRVAGVRTLEQANAYLEKIYIPKWETKFTVRPACADDAHRPLLPEHDLDAILSHVEQRVVTSDYTFRYGGRMYQIAPAQIVAGLRGAHLQIELRRDGSLRARFNGKYLTVTECVQPVKRPASRQRTAATAASPKADAASLAVKRKQWMERFWAKPAPTLTQAIQIANATS